jgi:hypothetical protein
MSLDRSGEICGESLVLYIAGAWDGKQTAASAIITLFLVTPNSDQGKTVGVRDYQMHAPLQLQRLSRVVPGPNTSAALPSKVISKRYVKITFRKNKVTANTLKP